MLCFLENIRTNLICMGICTMITDIKIQQQNQTSTHPPLISVVFKSIFTGPPVGKVTLGTDAFQKLESSVW